MNETSMITICSELQQQTDVDATVHVHYCTSWIWQQLQRVRGGLVATVGYEGPAPRHDIVASQ